MVGGMRVLVQESFGWSGGEAFGTRMPVVRAGPYGTFVEWAHGLPEQPDGAETRESPGLRSSLFVMQCCGCVGP